MRRTARALVVAAVACLWARTASAQLPDEPYVSAGDRLAVSAEVAGTVGGPSPTADTAFFDYTDYNHNALRTLRLRLLAEWRATAHIELLGEVRAENRDSLEAAALYVRWRPWMTHDVDIQVGRVPPVIGAFARHAYGRDNLVIGFPLAYQYLTSLRSDAQPASVDDILRMRARGWEPSFPVGSQVKAAGLPLVSGFEWDTGVEAHWHSGFLDYAAAVTRGAPASPAFRDARPGPNVSGRAAATLVPGLVVGVSGARGHWVNQDLLATFPDARRNSTQTFVGVDVEYGFGRTLVRGEWLRSRFAVPLVDLSSPLSAQSAFMEGRYRFHPRWQAAARIERLDFSDIQGTLNQGVPTPWDAPVRRTEVMLGYRALRNMEVRVGWQRNHRDGGRVHDEDYPALQVLYWF